MKELRTQLSRSQTDAAALRRVNSLTTDFVTRDDPAQRAALEKDRRTALTELELLNMAIAAVKKSIADLEVPCSCTEEARRANVPPSWLR